MKNVFFLLESCHRIANNKYSDFMYPLCLNVKGELKSWLDVSNYLLILIFCVCVCVCVDCHFSSTYWVHSWSLNQRSCSLKLILFLVHQCFSVYAAWSWYRSSPCRPCLLLVAIETSKGCGEILFSSLPNWQDSSSLQVCIYHFSDIGLFSYVPCINDFHYAGRLWLN